jgi:hypothetical protein
MPFMDSTRAFKLREGIDPETFGGSVTLPDGTSFFVHDALEENDGVIVTRDEALAVALDAYTALVSAAVPEDQRGYDALKVDELRAEVDRRNSDRDDDEKIEVAEPGNKPQLIAALNADDEETR